MLIGIITESLFIRLNSAPFIAFVGAFMILRPQKSHGIIHPQGQPKMARRSRLPLIGPCERTAASVSKKGRKWRPCPKG